MKTEASELAYANVRYQAKLDAMATGAAKVTVTPPPPPSPDATDPDSIQARYQAKLLKRSQPVAAPVASPKADTAPTVEADAPGSASESDSTTSNRSSRQQRR